MTSNIRIASLAKVSWLRSWSESFLPASSLSAAGFKKRCGASPALLLRDLIALVFTDTPLYRLKAEGRPDRSVYYDFLSKPRHNWTKLLYLAAEPIVKLFASLTSTAQRKVLVVDDSSYKRERSKMVEFLGHQFDHCSQTYFKGFRFLCLGWTDGHSFLPLRFELLTNQNPNKRIGPDPAYQGSSDLKQRIVVATKKATDVMVDMIKSAVDRGIQADYVVFDSWFAHAKQLLLIHNMIPVVCMIKKSPKQLYKLGGRVLTADSLYRELVAPRKAFQKHDWGRLQAQCVHMLGGPPVKLVFITSAGNPNQWQVLACTDLNLSAEEIVRIYAKRWVIEVFFKNAKQLLGMQNGCESRKFAAIIAHLSIVCLRCLLLEYARRTEADEKTIPGIFRHHKEELQAMAMVCCIQLILMEIAELCKNNTSASDIQALCQEFSVSKILDLIQNQNPSAKRPKSES